MIKFIKNDKKTQNKRKSIDIYFILYLTALVILIAGNNAEKQINPEEQYAHLDVEFPFRIKAERPLLVCRIVSDSLGQPLVLLDSINYLLDYGDVTDIRYEFVVEDTELRQRINLSKTNYSSKMFSFVHDTINRLVVFHWYPDLYDIHNLANKTYNIYVNASALPLGSAGTTEKHRMQAKAQFSLMILNERNAMANDNPYNVVLTETPRLDMPATLSGNQYQPLPAQYEDISLSADFSLKPQMQTVLGIAGDVWENTINCYGFSPARHLTKPPTIEIFNEQENNGGAIHSNSITNNSIVLKGKLPEFGNSKVTVSVQRKGDLKEQKISFNLNVLAIKMAEVPQTMYPNIEYTINPNLPDKFPEMSAYIKDKEIVRFRSYSNELIKFTPTQADIGKTLSFERWLNSKLIGQRHYINIKDFPAPEITEMSAQGKNAIILKVIAFGKYGELINSIKELKLTGNAKYISIYGKTHRSKARLESQEQFRIEPQDAGKPFVFEVMAVDQLGKTSNTKSYK